MIKNSKVECCISKNEKEIIKYVSTKIGYGVIRFDIGKVALVFKINDLKEILGGND